MAAAHDIFLVFVQGRDGKLDEYARWFTGVHMQDMARLPGVISASPYRLESLDEGDAPARLCAIYETGDGPGLLRTIAASKDTDALPSSDIQGPMIWRVLEGVRARDFAKPPGEANMLICMFSRPWDDAVQDCVWQSLCGNPSGLGKLRQTRLSPVQPARGSEVSGVLFVTMERSADVGALVAAIRQSSGNCDMQVLLARPVV